LPDRALVLSAVSHGAHGDQVIRVAFRITCLGSLPLVLCGSALCVLSGIGLGTVIATFNKSAQQAILTSFFVILHWLHYQEPSILWRRCLRGCSLSILNRFITSRPLCARAC
jgi:hypothetical protein